MASEARDYSAPPRTEFEGREYEATVTFYLVEPATEAEIEEWLEFELGGGSISMDHPLTDACLNRVSVGSVRATGYQRHIDWGETAPDGKCSGRGRYERVSA